MTTDSARDPAVAWDAPATAMVAELFAELDRAPRVRLDAVLSTHAPGRGPGIYVQFLSVAAAPRSLRGALEDTFSPLIAHGAVPWYQGSAKRLLPRLQRYRQSIRDLDIAERNIYVSCVPAATWGTALLGEAEVIAAGPGVMTVLGGWGQRIPGGTRRQRASPTDSLLRGRDWARPPSPVDEMRARAAVIAYLAGLDPAGPRWPPITGPNPPVVAPPRVADP